MKTCTSSSNSSTSSSNGTSSGGGGGHGGKNEKHLPDLALLNQFPSYGCAFALAALRNLRRPTR